MSARGIWVRFAAAFALAFAALSYIEKWSAVAKAAGIKND
jgi:hypothetical protein